jgi:Cd2+/Zn2+-exporting ATPase
MPKWAVFILFLIPYLLVGYDILRKAFKGIQNKQVFDENFLMTVATIGAIVLGEYGEGVAVMLLYQVGELFQSYAVGKSRRNISELMDIRPDYANIETEDGIEKVDPDEVEIGSIIVIQPGEKVPLDGEIVEGTSALNTSALTGESKPQDVAAGDTVLSGSINMTGVLKVRTTTEFDESTASKILDLVENAASRKSKSETPTTLLRSWMSCTLIPCAISYTLEWMISYSPSSPWWATTTLPTTAGLSGQTSSTPHSTTSTLYSMMVAAI